MLRMTLLALLAVAGCHHEPTPMTPKEGELPPLPPASGTPVGYLLDNATQLELRPDQVDKLKAIDASLAARNDGIDTQLREIERPEEEEEPAGRGEPSKPRNNAPGAAPIRTTADASKLHDAHNANNRDALEQAFAVLDPTQQAAARKLLDDRGIIAPGAPRQPPRKADDSGVPLEP